MPSGGCSDTPERFLVLAVLSSAGLSTWLAWQGGHVLLIWGLTAVRQGARIVWLELQLLRQAARRGQYAQPGAVMARLRYGPLLHSVAVKPPKRCWMRLAVCLPADPQAAAAGAQDKAGAKRAAQDWPRSGAAQREVGDADGFSQLPR